MELGAALSIMTAHFVFVFVFVHLLIYFEILPNALRQCNYFTEPITTVYHEYDYRLSIFGIKFIE